MTMLLSEAVRTKDAIDAGMVARVAGAKRRPYLP
jgi:hypothetical protein